MKTSQIKRKLSKHKIKLIRLSRKAKSEARYVKDILSYDFNIEYTFDQDDLP